MPENSCDVSASDRGPSCSRTEELKGKKFYLIRFISNHTVEKENMTKEIRLHVRHLLKSVRHQPAAISLTDILRPGKLVKKEPPIFVELEKFSMSSMQWVTEKTRKFDVEKNQFSREAFGNAFKATDIADGSKWVIKKYIPKAVKNMEDLRMTLEDYARKQV